MHKEYTFFTEQDFNKNLRMMGARVLYNAPHWDDNTVNKRFEGKFRIIDEEPPLSPPPAKASSRWRKNSASANR